MIEASHGTNDALQKLEWCIKTYKQHASTAVERKSKGEETSLQSHEEMKELAEEAMTTLGTLMVRLKEDYVKLGSEMQANISLPKLVTTGKREEGSREQEGTIRALKADVARKSKELQYLRQKGKTAAVDKQTFSNECAISSAAYLTLESLAFLTNSDRATLFLHVAEPTNRLQAITTVNTTEIDPAQMSIPVNKGLAGSVFSSKIALNIDAAYAAPSHISRVHSKMKYRVHNMLCFPIIGIDSSTPIGVVQLLNKCKGTVNFTEKDEALVASCKTLSYILSRYPVDPALLRYRSDELHVLRPFSDRSISGGSEKLDVPLCIQQFTPLQLIFRTRTSGHFVRYSELTSTAKVKNQTDLLEVDGYMKNLEDCWKKTTSEWVMMETNHAQVKQEANRRRRRLKFTEARLETTLQEKDQYKCAYQTIKSELEQQHFHPQPPKSPAMLPLISPRL